LLNAYSHDYELVKIETSGDKLKGPVSEAGGKSLWVREIEDALLEGSVDAAIHSAKDMPVELAEGLTVGAYPEREDPRDVFIGAPGRRFAALPPGSKVGTGSLRRIALLRSLRPDLEPVPIRGNLPTRLAKIESMNLDGVILASAGLIRLGMDDKILDPLDPERYIPAGGQGAIAVEIRIDDDEVQQLVTCINDGNVAAQVRAERAFLLEIGGDCHTPIGVNAAIHGVRLRLRALVLSTDGRDRIEGSAEGELTAPETLGVSLGRELLQRGARRILEAAE
jgi:hydroxymethylbilane synthase